MGTAQATMAAVAAERGGDAGNAERTTTGPASASRDIPPPDVTLSCRDLELLRLLADGALLGAVARRLRTSDRTVRRRIRTICDQLGVATPIQAVVWAAHRGLL